MKKTVIIILAVLPIFLIITISFAARILSTYQHIAVEKVRFTDENYVEYDSNFTLVINVGEEIQTHIKIFPELASNKNVEYFSESEEICTIDDSGIIKGVKTGVTRVVVKTEEGGKMSKLLVQVIQEKVLGVTLPFEELKLHVGDSVKLVPEIQPCDAKNQNVKYTLSNTGIVTIDGNGIVVVTGVGETLVTVTTEDGGFTDSCKIIVESGKPALKLDFSENSNITQGVNGYFVKTNTINLLNYLEIDESRGIIKEQVQFESDSNPDYATISTDGKLKIEKKGKVINIVVKHGIYRLDLKFAMI